MIHSMIQKCLFFICCLLVSTFIIDSVAVAQPDFGKKGRRGPRGPRGNREAELTKPFVGITADRKLVKDLFKIQSTGVSTKPVLEAAKAFLAGLSDEQRKKTTFPIDDIEWRKWDNVHFSKRQGVGFDEMTEDQRKLAFGLLQSSLSAKGLKLSQDIMKLNHTLAELGDNFDEYGQWLYWITIMGEPSETEPWGWQIDGHHLVVNYFVLGDQVVMSPVFVGSEPVTAKGGKFKGTVVLQDEQNVGLKLMQSLNDSQRSKATLSGSKRGANVLAEAYKDNINLDFAGLKVSEMEESQKQQLLELVKLYVGNMSEGHAKVRMAEVEKHLDETWFAWLGDHGDDGVFYYRIHSPVILIEFDHQRGVYPVRSREPSREHIHAVVRTPNGNDYGKDLLRQHFETHHK